MGRRVRYERMRKNILEAAKFPDIVFRPDQIAGALAPAGSSTHQVHGKGDKADWALEGRAPSVLLRAGWTKDSLKPGETVTVDMSPAKDGSKTV